MRGELMGWLDNCDEEAEHNRQMADGYRKAEGFKTPLPRPGSMKKLEPVDLERLVKKVLKKVLGIDKERGTDGTTNK